MTIYLVISISLLFMGLLYEVMNSTTTKLYRRGTPKLFFIIPSFILLFFISTYRGDFTTDYINYSNLFHTYNYYSFSDIFTAGFYQEIGYVFLNKLIGVFSTNEIYLFAVTTLIILFGFYHHISRYSVNIWLSILMFVTVGSYYTSFNITRQILAASIIFFGSRFLYERKFFKFVLIVILASLFHKTALIMIPFYFILNFRIRFSNIFFVLIGSSLVFYFFQDLLYLLQNLGIYDNYTDSSYGMTGASVANAVLPIAFALFAIIHSKKLDSKNNNMHRIWFNATIFYAVINTLSLQIQMIERLSYFFAPYSLLLIPFLFSKMKDKNLRFIYMMVLIALLIIYNYAILVDSVFDPYYFIWDK